MRMAFLFALDDRFTLDLSGSEFYQPLPFASSSQTPMVSAPAVMFPIDHGFLQTSTPTVAP